jgi:hypothetical protein
MRQISLISVLRQEFYFTMETHEAGGQGASAISSASELVRLRQAMRKSLFLRIFFSPHRRDFFPHFNDLTRTAWKPYLMRV